jgi:predicted  nucleic acid-binding Zn-ribbon protein
MIEKYEKKLKTERELCLRLKGENGLMRKKFNTLHKDIEENKVEEARMKEEEKKLKDFITTLENEVASLRKEVSGEHDLVTTLNIT